MLKRWILVGTTATAIAACGGGTVTDAPGPSTPPVDTTTPPVTVQRASITVRIAFDAGDAALAATAGIDASGVTVHLSRSTPGVPPQTGTTGSDGSVRFDNLLEGVYQVSVDRSLSAAETARLAPADREVSIFAGGASAVLSPPVNREVTVSLVGARRGSIVFSEIFAYNAPRTGGPLYGLGTYVELYNNADTTSYLDGMLFVTSGGLHTDRSPSYPCTAFPQNMRLDSTAIYSALILAFPGSGRDYPIQPGEAKVLAMDAIDHRAAAPTMQQVDLSRAHFEQYFSDSDTDNPEAANMVRVYTAGSTGAFGRGFPVNSGRRIYALMLPAARAAMTLTQFPNTAGASGVGQLYDVYRIPSEYLVDVLGLEYAPTIFGYENTTPACAPWSAYERAPAPLVDDNFRKAIARRSLGRTSDGREILQRTRTSARDFEYVDPLRRSLDR